MWSPVSALVPQRNLGTSAYGAARGRRRSGTVAPTRRRRWWSSAPISPAVRPANGGATFHDRGGPYGRQGAKRIIAVDVTGLPVGALVVPASTPENRASQLMLEHLTRQRRDQEARVGPGGPRGHGGCRPHLGRGHELVVRRVGWEDKQPVFRPIRPPGASRVAHGQLGRSRRLAESFGSTTCSATGWLQVACVATTLRHLSRARPQLEHTQSRPEPSSPMCCATGSPSFAWLTQPCDWIAFRD